MIEKWGEWFIATMPDGALDSAIEDTRLQLERVAERLKAPSARSAEFEKTELHLKALRLALAQTKAYRNG